MTDLVAKIRADAGKVKDTQYGPYLHHYLLALADSIAADPLYKAAPELRAVLQFALDNAPLENYNVNGEFERRAKAVLATLPKDGT